MVLYIIPYRRRLAPLTFDSRLTQPLTMIDHDRLFKELLSTFFIEFIELFFPNVMTYLEPDSVTFLDKRCEPASA
jgi:hypothetical protein